MTANINTLFKKKNSDRSSDQSIGFISADMLEAEPLKQEAN